jgi:hypothetical protein
MDKPINTGRRRYLTEDEKEALRDFINDNNGIEGSRIKLGMTRWNTLDDIFKKGYCSPHTYKKLNRKIFSKLAA